MNINNGFNDIPQSKCDENIYKKDKYPIIYKQTSIQLYTKQTSIQTYKTDKYPNLENRQVSKHIQTDKYPNIYKQTSIQTYKTDKYPNI